MTEEQLLTLEAFARLKRIQLVADCLHISPSTVLARLEALEREMGKALVRRGRRGELTSTGKSGLQHVVDAISAMQAFRETMADEESKVEILSIGVTPILASTHLPSWIRVWPEAQGRNIRITVCHSAEIVQLAETRKIDLGFGFDFPLQGHPLQVRSLGVDPLVGVMPIQWRIEPNPVAPWSLTPFIMCASQQPLWINLRKALYRGGHFPNKPWIEVDDLDGARSLVLQGIGWGILPHTLIAEDIVAGRVIAMQNGPWKLPHRHCMVVWPDNLPAPADEHTLELWQRSYTNEPITQEH